MITVRRASGLAVPFDPPEVTSEAAIERSWEFSCEGRLLLPKRPEYLKTTPLPCWCSLRYPWGFAPARIPWHDEYDFLAGISPLIGLPEV